jgi:hypothetical protein
VTLRSPSHPLLLPAALACVVGLAFGHDSAATEPRLNPRLITLRRPPPRLLTPTRELQSAAFACLAKHRLSCAPITVHSLHPAALDQPNGNPVADDQFASGEVLHGSGYVPPGPPPHDPGDVVGRHPIPLSQHGSGRACCGLLPEPANVGIGEHRSPIAGPLAGRSPTPDTRKRPRHPATAFVGFD